MTEEARGVVAAPDPGELLTTHQAAEMLGMSWEYTRRAMMSGRLPAQRKGRRYLTTRRQVQAYEPSLKAPTRLLQVEPPERKR